MSEKELNFEWTVKTWRLFGQNIEFHQNQKFALYQNAVIRSSYSYSYSGLSGSENYF